MPTPRFIGRYEVIDEIGRGAMGVVYLAHDPRIDRKVAIKTIHALDVLPGDEAEEIRQRFAREAQAAGRLQHPGIVTIFDVGEHAGTAFIAMEYIEGRTLDRHTRRESLLPVHVVLDLISQACDALDYAHQHHIVHRDIKPANMMLLGNGRLKITDFGLAKNPQASLTQEGILIGTPNYMSPEQVMGRPLDGRSDLFSLAAVFYELLTGERSFAGDTVTTIIYRILHEQPREPRLVNGKVPAALGPILMQALAKDPAQRFVSCREMARAIQSQVGMVAVAAAGGSSAGVAMMTGPVRGVVTDADTLPGIRRPSIPEPGPPTSRGAPAAPATRPRPARREAGHAAEAVAPRARAAAGWYGRVRSAFTICGALAVVLLLPVAGTRDDRWGRGESDGKAPFYRTVPGAASLGIGPGAGSARTAPAAGPQVTLPGGREMVSVTFTTSPPGGRIYVNDVEAPGGVATIPAGDTSPRTIVAENDCFIETITWQPGARGSRPSSIELKTPRLVKLPVESRPPGAAILLDGRDLGLTTPADVAVPACGAHAVELKLEGHKPAVARFDAAPPGVSLALDRIPQGFVRINAPYDLVILEKGRRVGASGESIRLPGGSHTLVLRNEDLFVEKTIQVKVQDGRTVTPAAALPGLGRVTILASPSNCVVSIDGREIGAPPIIDRPLAAGAHRFRAVYVPTGEAKETTVTVPAGGATRVPFKFAP